MKETNEMMEIIHQNHKKALERKEEPKQENTKYFDIMTGFMLGEAVVILVTLLVFELFIW